MTRSFAAFATFLAAAAVIAHTTHLAAAQDKVAICGGFVRPATKAIASKDSDFSVFRVKLLTPEGAFKAEIDVGKNGYYVIPIYDKGTYVLRLEGPEGWSLAKSEYEVKVFEGGESTCSDDADIDFLLDGFRVTGTVAACDECDNSWAPRGVTVRLVDQYGEEVAYADTDGSGSFAFSAVVPGEYSVVASHPRWVMSPTPVSVTVGWAPTSVPAGLSVAGFDVTGVVLAGAQPVEGVSVFLYTPGSDVPVSCAAVPSDVTVPPSDLGQPRCFAKSRADGSFTLSGVPCGTFRLVSHHESAMTSFTVQPSHIDAHVVGGSLLLDEKFTVVGFSLSGSVRTPSVDGVPGAGISGVKIFVDGKEQAVTNEAGRYTVTAESEGRITITAQADHVEFSSLRSLQVSHTMGALPDIVVSKYALCGRVNLGLVPPSHQSTISSRRKVTLSGGDGSSESQTTDDDGHYCFMVAPGDYTLHAVVSSKEVDAGLSLVPKSLSVAVSASKGPVKDADFSSLQLSLSGSVKCVGPCPEGVSLQLSLAQAPAGKPVTTQLQADNTFVFNGLWPSKYTVALVAPSRCWGESHLSAPLPGTHRIQVALSEKHSPEIVFEQSGVVMRVDSDHRLALEMSKVVEDGQSASDSFTVPVGESEWCISDSGLFAISADDCFTFREPVPTFDASNPSKISLHVKKYKLSGFIRVGKSFSGEPSSVTVTASNAAGKSKKASVVSAGAGVFQYSIAVTPGSEITITPSNTKSDAGPDSPELIFYPASRTVAVPTDACPGAVDDIIARPGVYLSGTISPPLEGVTVTVTVRDPSPKFPDLPAGAVVATVTSDSDGKYVAGPLHDALSFALSAEKEGYHFKGRGTDGTDFVHMRLGQVTVSVKDDAGEPVSGVLLSLSGDDYRKNDATKEDGTYSALDLFPGHYFLRAMLKEYSFSPASLEVGVEEGGAHTAEFQAKRIAFSVFGTAVSLNGDPQSGLVVTAVADGIAPETTTTDSAGNYRVRGLLPGHSYTVTLGVPGKSSSSFRSSPASRVIDVSREDTFEQNFVVSRRRTQNSISVQVSLANAAAAEHVDKLTVVLAPAANPDMYFKSAPITFAKFVEFSSVPDGEYAVWVSSSLSNRDFVVPANAQLVSVGPDSIRGVVSLDATVLPRDFEDNIALGPFYTLLCAVAGIAVFLKRDVVFPAINDVVGKVSGGAPPSSDARVSRAGTLSPSSTTNTNARSRRR